MVRLFGCELEKSCDESQCVKTQLNRWVHLTNITEAARGAPRHDQRRVVWGVYDETTRRGANTYPACIRIHELELELIQTQMAQKPMLRAEVYAHAMRASQNLKKEVRREKEV